MQSFEKFGDGMLNVIEEEEGEVQPTALEVPGQDALSSHGLARVVYSEAEFDIMKQDIIKCKSLGVNGIVSGVLIKDNTIDIERTKELISLNENFLSSNISAVRSENFNAAAAGIWPI